MEKEKDKAKDKAKAKTNTNALTTAIIKYLIFSGHHANRINNIPFQVKNRSGQSVYCKATMQKGISDIIACINGKYIAIEIKVGDDKQSPDQKMFQEDIEKAGGVYIIISKFDQFQDWYVDNILN